MKKTLLTLFVLTLFSCERGNVEGLDSFLAMDAHKFTFEGNHYIQFKFTNTYGGGVTLDPDYMFKGDTIVYGGNKYVKLTK